MWDDDQNTEASSEEAAAKVFRHEFGSDRDLNSEHGEHEERPDPFSPLTGIPDEEENILTFRALAIGVFCGVLVNASNIYLGLKSGWSVSANLFASITGFALLRLCSSLPFIGGGFGPRENNIAQTTAIAAGGMSNVFVSAFPAMYQLGLLRSPAEDFWRLVSLTAVGGYFGFFFATPLRKFFIILAARDLNLIFPTPSATAVTIRDMHRSVKDASSAAKRKMQILNRAFAFSTLLRIISPFAPGILWDWHVFMWYRSIFPKSAVALALESWGWYIELSPAFVATGMLVGLNAAISYFIGTLLAWGVVGPLIISSGLAFAKEESTTGLSLYHDISETFATAGHPGPRYWLLWPGIIGMIAVSLTEMVLQWKALVLPAMMAWRMLRAKLYDVLNIPQDMAQEGDINATRVRDCAPEKELITTAMWLPGLVVTIVLGCIVMYFQYDLPPLETLLAFALAFGFSFLTTQTTGATDITPLTAASASSQVIMGAESSGRGWSQPKVQRLGLLGGALSAMGAMQAADLTGDFRVGFLLRTSPRRQWLAQGIGTAFAAVIAPGTYTMFASAYGCMHDPAATRCDFHVPAAAAWRAIAISSTSPSQSIPRSSLIFAACLAVLGIAVVALRHVLGCTPGSRWRGIRDYLPNMMLVCLGFVIPATVYAIAILAGALLASTWTRRAPRSFDVYGYAVAAGLIAGEGVGGVLNAALQMAGVSGDLFGTTIGCPGGIC